MTKAPALELKIIFKIITSIHKGLFLIDFLFLFSLLFLFFLFLLNCMHFQARNYNVHSVIDNMAMKQISELTLDNAIKEFVYHVHSVQGHLHEIIPYEDT